MQLGNGHSIGFSPAGSIGVTGGGGMWSLSTETTNAFFKRRRNSVKLQCTRRVEDVVSSADAQNASYSHMLHAYGSSKHLVFASVGASRRSACGVSARIEPS